MKNLVLLSLSFALFFSCNFLEKKNTRRFILQFNTREILVELAGQNRQTPDFIAAIATADSLQKIKKNKKYGDLFFQVLASKKIPVSKFYDNSVPEINLQLGKAKTITCEVLLKRLRPDQKNPSVTLIPDSDLIKVEVHADEDGSFTKTLRLITSKSNLSFRYLKSMEEIQSQLIEANNYLIKKFPSVSLEENLSTDEDVIDTVTSSISPLLSLNKAQNSLVYSMRDQAQIHQLINLPEVKALFPTTELIWMVPTERDSLVELMPVQIPSSPMEVLSGNHIIKAEANVSEQTQAFEINFSFDESASRQWKSMTRFASQSNPRKRIAIILDEVCLMAPTVQGEIPSGQCSISGDFSFEEAQAIARMMVSGSLPTSLMIIEEQEIK